MTVVIGPNDLLTTAYQRMKLYDVSQLPVMDGDTLMCVISFHDVAKAVLEERNFENKLLKAYIKDWPAEAK